MEFVPILVDYDLYNKDLENAKISLQKYCNTRRAIGLSSVDSFFGPRVSKLADLRSQTGDTDQQLISRVNNENGFLLNVQLPDSGKKFADYIGYDHLGPSTVNKDRTLGTLDLSPTKYLFDSLYNDSSNDNPMLSLDLQIGFKGNPNIGSIVLHELTQSLEYRHFLNCVNDSDRVIVVGSIFGGTGSSGIPRIISDLLDNTNPTIRRVIKGAVVVMPYYKIKPNDRSPIDSNTFELKTKEGLSFYRTRVNGINALYYLADKYVTKSYDHNQGGIDQHNEAHLVELLSATAILDFANKDFTNENNVPINTSYELGMIGNKDQANVNYLDFYDMDGTDEMFAVKYLKPLACFCFFERFYNNHLSKNKFATNHRFHQIVKDVLEGDKIKLKDFLNDFNEWNDEIKSNSRSLKLFDKTKELYSQMLTHNVWKSQPRFGGILKTSDPIPSSLIEGWINEILLRYENENVEVRFIKVLSDAMVRLFNSANDRDLKTK
jgi:hypothetical protein